MTKMKPTPFEYLAQAISRREWIWAEAALREVAGSVACTEVERGRDEVVRQLGHTAWYSIELRASADGLEVVHSVGTRGHDTNSIQMWGEGGSLEEALANAVEEKQPWRPEPRRKAVEAR